MDQAASRIEDDLPKQNGGDATMVDAITRAWEEARDRRLRGELLPAIASLRSAGLMALRSGEAEKLRASQIKVDLAVLYIDTRSLGKAHCFARSGLRGLESSGGTTNKIAGAHNTIANVFWYQRDVSKALKNYEKALQHYQRGDCAPDDLGRTYENIALCLPYVGREDEVGDMLKKALALPLSPTQKASVEYRLGAFYDRSSKFDLALQTFERLLPYADCEQIPQALASIGIMKDRLGEAKGSLESFRKAVTAAARLKAVRHHFINIVCNYAERAASLGYADEARKALRQANKWSSQTRTPLDEQTILTARAAVAGYQGTSRSVVTLLRKLEASRRELSGDDSPYVLEVRVNLADELGKHNPAKAFEALSSAIARCSAPPSSIDIIVAKSALAFLALQQDRLDVAGPLAREAFLREASIGLPELRWRTLALLACVSHAAGMSDAAILLMKISAEIARQLLLRTPDLATFRQITEMRTRFVYSNLIEWLVAAGRFPEAERLHLAERATTSLELTRKQPNSDAASVPTPMTSYEQAAALELQEIGTAWRAEVTDAELAGLKVAAGDLAHPRAESIEAWLTKATAFRIRREAIDRSLGVEAVGEERDVLLHYIVASGRVIAIARSRAKETRVELKDSEGAINAACYEFRQAILGRLDGVDALGQNLFDALVRPVWDVVEDAATLHVVPDGAMRYLPFCALRNEAGYLVEAMPIQYVPVVPCVPKPAIERRRWMAAGMGTSVLAHAKAELEAIPSANTAAILLDKGFDRDGFSAALNTGVEIIHVVSHFRLDPANVELSSLEMGDGTTMMLEEFRERRFDFSNVELLILSACDTGTVALGKANSESLAGLFQLQGARRVMATLWPVSDDSAAELATQFYRFAFADAGQCELAQALRAAQLSMIRSKPSRNHGVLESRGGFGLRQITGLRHPYFWASHVLYSE